jgi:hypothetical protein
MKCSVGRQIRFIQMHLGTHLGSLHNSGTYPSFCWVYSSEVVEKSSEVVETLISENVGGGRKPLLGNMPRICTVSNLSVQDLMIIEVLIK